MAQLPCKLRSNAWQVVLRQRASIPACRLEYVKEAVAEADPVTKMTGLMKQRRRWLNGTFFAMLYALSNMGRIWTESGRLCSAAANHTLLCV